MKRKWGKRFWSLAKFVSKWSKDPRAKVGAVLVNKKGEPIALGYNGFPTEVEDSADRLQNKKLKNEMVVHAEQNALLIAGKSSEGAELYVFGKPICSRCAGLIIQAGVSKIVTMDPETMHDGSQWGRRGRIALEMFEEAGIEIKKLAA